MSTDVRALLSTAVSAVGGTPRPGQIAMAEAVAAAATDRVHLLVQAGTGTGKSLGYLVPAIHRAVETGRPVVVSTATLALQAQIVGRDLPRIAAALAPALGREPTWQLVKGRRNYLCLHKVEGGYPEEAPALFADPDEGPGSAPVAPAPTSRLGREVARLRDWAADTSTGDRDELDPGVSERAWRQVSVGARECLGSQRCPFAQECFVEQARVRAHEVDVVVTNHALVAIDSFENRSVLPEHDLLILDEAHDLADRVTAAVSAELSPGALEEAARRCRATGSTSGTALTGLADSLTAELERAPEGRQVATLPEGLAAVVESVRDTAREAGSDLRQEASAAASDGARQLARASLGEVFDVADRIAAGGFGPEGPDVVWVSRPRRQDGAGRPLLHVAPISVAGRLREGLYDDRVVVLTSATLTPGGSFEAAAVAAGLSPGDRVEAGQRPAAGPGGDRAGGQQPQEPGDVPVEPVPAWRGMDVGSPFDYPRQGILYLASSLPAPGRDGLPEPVLEEIDVLVGAAGGRTLGLFSSRRAAEQAAEELRARQDRPVLCQGDDSTPNLVRAFAADPATCLFGTLSLWQGVDVPGPSCQLVIIDRIPFPRPDDPLATARQQAVTRRGGNGFMAVAAAHAALRLAQGSGRLIRSTADRGVVAVLDPRLATARYGGFLRASMPPFWCTRDRATVLRALDRIDRSAVDGGAGRERAGTTNAPGDREVTVGY